jgi:hypothetical protein
LMTANFTVALGGAVLILIIIDQPLDGLRANWVASRQLKLRPEEIVASGRVEEKQIV